MELIAAYWQHVESYYVKPVLNTDGSPAKNFNGSAKVGPTSEQNSIRVALRPLRRLYGHTIATEFGPLSLEAVRKQMIELGWVRTQINKSVDRIRRMFRWAVAKQMLPPSVYEAMRALDDLREGRSAAAESQPVRPVPPELIEEL